MQCRAVSSYKPQCRCEATNCKLCSLKRTRQDLELQLRETGRCMVRERARQRSQSVPYGLTQRQRQQMLCTRVRNKPSSSPLPSLGFVHQLYTDASEDDVRGCVDPQTAAQKKLHNQSTIFLAEAGLFRWVRRQNFESHSAPTTASALAEYRAALGSMAATYRSRTDRGGRKWLQRWGKRWDVGRGSMPFRVDVEAAQLPQKVGMSC